MQKHIGSTVAVVSNEVLGIRGEGNHGAIAIDRRRVTVSVRKGAVDADCKQLKCSVPMDTLKTSRTVPDLSASPRLVALEVNATVWPLLLITVARYRRCLVHR